MNKKVNTVLFILAATVVNIGIMIILLLLGLLLLGRLLPQDFSPEIGQILFLLVFVASIAGAFFLYNRIIKLVSKKIDMDKYFDPIFRPRTKK